MNRAKKDAPPRFPEFREAFLELMGDMTLEQFAKKLGMSRATVGFYAAGQRKIGRASCRERVFDRV